MTIPFAPAFLALASLLSTEALATAAEARVELLQGRVVVHQEGRPERLARPQESLDWPAGADLEVGAGAQVRLTWTGTASWHVWGPARIEWTTEPAKPGAEEGLRFLVHDLAWADVEIRRGEHRLELPAHWTARLQSGALHLRSLPSGPMEIRYHAGTPLVLLWSGDPEHVRPPVTVYPGSSLRLERPPEGAADKTSHAESWNQPSWPWRERTDTPEEAHQRPGLVARNERQIEGAKPWPTQVGEPAGHPQRLGEFDPRVRVYVDEPAAGRLPAGPAQPPSGIHPPSPTGVHAQLGAPAQPDHASTGVAPLDPWRGVPSKDLIAAGFVWVQRGPGVEVRAAGDGRWKVLVDHSAKRNVWCFGRTADWSLAPGSVALFDAEGRLRSSLGGVEEVAPVAGRPSSAVR